MKARFLKFLILISGTFLLSFSAHAQLSMANSIYKTDTICNEPIVLKGQDLQQCGESSAFIKSHLQLATAHPSTQKNTSIPASKGDTSVVSEPSTAALMVLGFGILSMVVGAKLKNR